MLDASSTECVLLPSLSSSSVLHVHTFLLSILQPACVNGEPCSSQHASVAGSARAGGLLPGSTSTLHGKRSKGRFMQLLLTT